MKDNSTCLAYNKVDFVVPANRFRIVFSYMDKKGLSFIREFILRLLNISPMKPGQIAAYFDLSRHETDLALDDLYYKDWLMYQENGDVALSPKGKTLFSSVDNKPEAYIIKDYAGTYYLELFDNNFLTPTQCNNDSNCALFLTPSHENQANSKSIVTKQFQYRFQELRDDKIIELNDEYVEIYKIASVEAIGKGYFRFTQQFELLLHDSSQKERTDIQSIKRSDEIQQAITQLLNNNKPASNNLKDVVRSMGELDDNETLHIFLGGKIDTHKFFELNNKRLDKGGLYFIGQLYHQERCYDLLNTVFKDLAKKHVDKPKDLLWIAPSDIYWGEQKDVLRLARTLDSNALITKNKVKKRLYDLAIYFPLESERDKRAINKWQKCFSGITDELYGFIEGFLNGNTEIIILEGVFAIVCYHVKLTEYYDVTIPIGFFTQNKEEISKISQVVNSYLNVNYNENNLGKFIDIVNRPKKIL